MSGLEDLPRGPLFSASDARAAGGITYRQLNDWESRGLLPHDPNRGEGWRRWTGRELFVLLVTAELRSRFGIPPEKLRWVSAFMLQEGANHFEVALTTMVMTKAPVWIVTDFSDRFEMEADSEIRELVYSGLLRDDAGSIFLRVSPLVNRILGCLKKPWSVPEHDDSRAAEALTRRIGSPEEWLLLQSVRSGDAKRVEVTLRDGTIKTIRSTRERDPEQELRDILAEGDFQRVTVTQKHGRVVSVEQEVTSK